MERRAFCGKMYIYGSKREIDDAISILQNVNPGSYDKEVEARLLIQDLIDKHNIKASILYDGNTVYSKKRIIRDLKLIVKHNDMSVMTDYLYNFLSSCGSIAHFNKYGWIETYPTVFDLRKFFMFNEFGQPVIQHIPRWATDQRRIVEEIDIILEREYN